MSFVDYIPGISSAVDAIAGIWANERSITNANRQNDIARQFNAQQNELNRDFTLDLQNRNQQFQRDMWDANNQYNTPSAQMQRYRSAGLNPFLLSGVGQVGSGSSTLAASSPASAPSSLGSPSTSPSVSAPRFGLAENFASVRAADANNASSRSVALKNAVEAAMSIKQGFGRRAAQNFLNQIIPQFGISSYEHSMTDRLMSATIDKEEGAAREQSIRADLARRFGADESYARLENLHMQSTELGARIGRMASEAKVNDATINRIAAEIKNLLASAGFTNERSSVYRQAATYIIGNLKYSALQKQYEYDVDESIRNFDLSSAGQNVRLGEYLYNRTTDAVQRIEDIVLPIKKAFKTEVPNLPPSSIRKREYHRGGYTEWLNYVPQQ